MVRSILECACPVWHAGLTSDESDLYDQTEKCELKINYPDLKYLRLFRIASFRVVSVRHEN